MPVYRRVSRPVFLLPALFVTVAAAVSAAAAAPPKKAPPKKPSAAKTAAKPTPVKAPAKTTVAVPVSQATLPFRLFTRSIFAPPHLTTSAPTVDETKVVPELNVTVCAEEAEPVTFSLYAPAALLSDVNIFVKGDVTSGKNKLPESAVQVYVVAPQAGIAENQTPALLLVKDDRAPLTGPLPEARLTGNALTDIAAKTVKQIWVSVDVPRRQPPGTYSGTIAVTAGGKTVGVPLTVEVPAMRLRSPFLLYGVDFPTHLSEEAADPHGPLVTPILFQRQLENVAAHGFQFVSLYDPLPALGEALRAFKDAGLSANGPAIVMSPVQSADQIEAITALKNSVGRSFNLYYGVPTPPTPEQYDAVRDLFTLIGNTDRGARTLAPVSSSEIYDTLGDTLTAPVYPISSDYVRQLLEQGGGRRDAKRDFWSWDIAAETPLRNRLLSGLLLYSTHRNSAGLFGAFPGPFQCVLAGDPLRPEPGVNPTDLRMATYPAAGGVINTVQWEAAREGIDDIRYITNLKTYIRELKDLKVAAYGTAIANAETYLSDMMKKPVDAMTPQDLQENRRRLREHCLNLLTLLRRHFNGGYPD